MNKIEPDKIKLKLKKVLCYSLISQSGSYFQQQPWCQYELLDTKVAECGVNTL